MNLMTTAVVITLLAMIVAPALAYMVVLHRAYREQQKLGIKPEYDRYEDW